MKSIKLNDYNFSMGTLIDVRHPLDYNKGHINGSINIYADKLLASPSKYLNKNSTYYIICEKGILSLRVVRMLTILGYKAVQVKH
jgi:rhodanese-related sulfurtransferase